MGNIISFYEQYRNVSSAENTKNLMNEATSAISANNLQFESNDSTTNNEKNFDCKNKSLTLSSQSICCSSFSRNLHNPPKFRSNDESTACNEPILSNDTECHDIQFNGYSIMAESNTTTTTITTIEIILVTPSSLNFVTTCTDMTHKKCVMSQVHHSQDQCAKENSTLASLGDTKNTIQRVIMNRPKTKNNKQFDCSQQDNTSFTIRTTSATGNTTTKANANDIILFSDKYMNIINFNKQPVTNAQAAPPLLSIIINTPNIMRSENDQEEHISSYVIHDVHDLCDLCHHSPVINHHLANICDTFALALENSPTQSNINFERNKISHFSDFIVILYELKNGPNVTLSAVPREYQLICANDNNVVGDVKSLSPFINHDRNLYKQLHKTIQSTKIKRSRSFTSKNIIESDVCTNEYHYKLNKTVSDSELNKIIIQSKKVDLNIESRVNFDIDFQIINEMKLDMKSSGKSKSNETANISESLSKGIPNNASSATLKNIRNSAIHIPRYERISTPLNNICNVDSKRLLNNNRNVNINGNRALSDIYNGTSKHTLGNAPSNLPSNPTLKSEPDVRINHTLRNAPNEINRRSLGNTNRTLSIDTALDTVTPPRMTRLKQHRHFCSQDECDDPVERLNRLKARISGALSEVKGVLKQYSVDNEDIECPNEVDNNIQAKKEIRNIETSERQHKSPIQFRFVKKVHSRSSFAEEDEEDDKIMLKSFEDLDASKITTERKSKLNKSNDQLKKPIDNTTDKKDLFISTQNDRPLNTVTTENYSEVNCVKKSLTFNNKAGEMKDNCNSKFPTEEHILTSTKVKQNHNDLNSVIIDASKAVKPKAESKISKQLNLKLKVKDNQEIVKNEDILENKENLKKAKSPEVTRGFSKNENASKINENSNIVEENGVIKKSRKSKVETGEEQVKTSKNLCDTLSQIPPHEIQLQTSTQNDNQKSLTEKSESLLQQTLCKSEETVLESNDNKLMLTITDKVINKIQNTTPTTVKTEDDKKPKKKVISTNKEPNRRSSVSCVDNSKLTTLCVPGHIKRRPSDSEWIMKKKINNATEIPTTGTTEEMTSQTKIGIFKMANLSASQEADKRSVMIKNPVNNSNVNASVINVKASRPLNGHSNDILIPSETTNVVKVPHIENNTEMMPKQIPINETINDRTIIAKEQPLMAISTTVKAANKTTNQENSKTTINLQENNAEIKTCSTKADIPTAKDRKDNKQLEMLSNSHNLTNVKYAITENKEKKDLTDKIESSSANILNTLKTELDVEQSLHNDNEQVTTIAAIKVDDIDGDNDIKIKSNSALNQMQTNTTPFIDKLASGITNDHSTNKSNHQIINIQYCTPTIVNSCEESIQQDTATDKYCKETLKKVPELKVTASESAATVTTTTTIIQDSTISLNHLYSNSELLVDFHDKEMPEQQTAPAPVQQIEILAADLNVPKEDIYENSLLTLKENESGEFTTEDNKVDLLVDKNVEDIVLLKQEAIAEPITPETIKPKKERKVKKKVIIKRQKRRLSITDSFFQNRSTEELSSSTLTATATGTATSSDTETLEKPIAFVTDDEDDKCNNEIPDVVKKPLKSCMKIKEYEIGDEVLYPERFKKTQVRWKRGKIIERITSISYLIDIDGKEVSSHVNYLKKYTNRKVKFSGKEYLEIDYEQLAEEEEKAEILRKRTQSIWNMV